MSASTCCIANSMGRRNVNSEQVVCGAPENARGLTAYSCELMGDDVDRHTTRDLAAVLPGLGLAGLRRPGWACIDASPDRSRRWRS